MADDKNYVGAGGDSSYPELIEDEETLLAVLGNPPAEGGDAGAGTATEEEDDEAGTQAQDGPQEGDDAPPAGDEGKKGKEGEGDQGSETFPTGIHYLNNRFGLKMNLQNLPEGITQEEQFELVGDIFERASRGFQSKIQEFTDIAETLKDEEVASFIAAKRSGKTLADFVRAYAQTPGGMSDEGIVRSRLEKQYQAMDEAERSELIEDTIQGYKDKNKLDKVAAAYRKAALAEEQAATAAEQKRIADEQAAAQQRRNAEVLNYQNYVNGHKEIGGVKLSDDMKRTIIEAGTRIVDEEGNTALDRALQSDEGVMLATLGIFYMNKLLGAKGSKQINRQNKSLLERLYDDPDKLQSGSSRNPGEDDFNLDAANSF